MVVLNGQNLSWTNVHAGVPQGSILGRLLFLIYVNNLSENLISNAKLFSDDSSLFSAVHDVNIFAKVLRDDLNKVNDWAFQWKALDPDRRKQAHKFIFSRNSKRPTHPPLISNNNNVSQTFSQKDVGAILDFKLTFEDHLNNVLATVMK